MNMRLRLVLVVALLTLMSCNNSDSQQSNLTLPANWPIPQLTLPPGAELSSAPSVMLNLHLNDTPLDRNIYSAQFTTGGPWTAAASHVEKCLAPLSYVEHVIVYPDGSTSRDQLCDYWSPDEKTEVELTPMPAGKTPAVILRITEYSQPQPVLSSHDSVTSKGVRTEIRSL